MTDAPARFVITLIAANKADGIRDLRALLKLAWAPVRPALHRDRGTR